MTLVTPQPNRFTWEPTAPIAPGSYQNPGGTGRKRETARANRALRDYCYLEGYRSLKNLLEKYANDPAAPTHSLDTLKKWSVAYSWYTRVEVYDSIQCREEDAIKAKRRRTIVETGLALRFERIEKLKHIYASIEPYLSRAEFIWQVRMKKLPTPEGGFELVETHTFNTGFINQLRSLLADIAREVDDPENNRPLTRDDYPVDFDKVSDQELEILLDIFHRNSKTKPDQDELDPPSNLGLYRGN